MMLKLQPHPKFTVLLCKPTTEACPSYQKQHTCHVGFDRLLQIQCADVPQTLGPEDAAKA